MTDILFPVATDAIKRAFGLEHITADSQPMRGFFRTLPEYKRHAYIVLMSRNNPLLTVRDMADVLGISKSAVSYAGVKFDTGRHMTLSERQVLRGDKTKLKQIAAKKPKPIKQSPTACSMELELTNKQLDAIMQVQQAQLSVLHSLQQEIHRLRLVIEKENQ